MNERIVKAAIDHYSKLSNEELMTELAKYMSAQKAKDGGASVLQTVERIKPLLNEEQRKRLEEVLNASIK